MVLRLFLPLCVCYRATLLCEWAASWINHPLCCLSAAAYWWELNTISPTDTHTHTPFSIKVSFSIYLSVDLFFQTVTVHLSHPFFSQLSHFCSFCYPWLLLLSGCCYGDKDLAPSLKVSPAIYLFYFFRFILNTVSSPWLVRMDRD